MTAAFTVHGHFNSSPAARVVLFLRMAGVEFAYRHVDLKERRQKTPEFLALNRFGRVPTLVHGNVSIAESTVILSYLAAETGQFGGDGDAQTRRLAEWLAWLADNLLPMQRARAVRKFNGDAAALPYLDTGTNNALTQLEGHLAGKPFIDGERVTIADILVFPYASVAEEAAVSLDRYPEINAWYARMLELPGVLPQYALMPTADIG